MSTTCDVSAPNASPSRYAAEWGLASLLMGGVLCVMGGFMLLLNLQMFLSPPVVWGKEDLDRLQLASILGGVVLIGFCVISLVMGVVGVVAAFRRCQPCALGLAGILLSLAAITVWFIAMINLHDVATVLMQRQGMQVLFGP